MRTLQAHYKVWDEVLCFYGHSLLMLTGGENYLLSLLTISRFILSSSQPHLGIIKILSLKTLILGVLLLTKLEFHNLSWRSSDLAVFHHFIFNCYCAPKCDRFMAFGYSSKVIKIYLSINSK